MTPSQSFRIHTSKRNLRLALLTQIPKMQGVGLDGIHPSSVDSWDSSRIDSLTADVSTALRSGGHRFTSYREGLAPRGRNQPPRVFSIPTIRDRLALHVLKKTLSDTYGFSGPEPAQRKIRRVIDAVQSGAYSHYVRLDIRDFYPSIRRESLMMRLRREIRSDAILTSIERSIRNSTVPFGTRSSSLSSEPDGIPLGISISPLLAEVYLLDYDSQFASRMCFFRYVDDILVLTGPGRDPLGDLESSLRKIGLQSHPRTTKGKCETGSISAGFDYLGYRIDANKVLVSAPGIERIENQLARLISQAARVPKGPAHKREFDRLIWRLNLVVGGCVIDGTARGWIRYYNRTDSLTILGHLDWLIRSLISRYDLTLPGEIKSFTSAYWASLDDERFRRYAYDLDRATPDEARQHLVEIEEWSPAVVMGLSDSDAQTAYRRAARRHAIEIERDWEPPS